MNSGFFHSNDSECFSPTVAYLIHKEPLQWLDEKLNEKHDGKTVVVTHHAPTMNSTNNYTYGSKLEEFIKKIRTTSICGFMVIFIYHWIMIFMEFVWYVILEDTQLQVLLRVLMKKGWFCYRII